MTNKVNKREVDLISLIRKLGGEVKETDKLEESKSMQMEQSTNNY